MIIVRVYHVIAIFGNEMKLTTMKIKEILDDWTNKGNEALMQRAHMNHESLHYGWTDYEKNKKNSISRRTIERCIEGDRRIIKNGWYYSIDKDARFETRYRNPKEFGALLYDEVVLSKHLRYNEKSMRKMRDLRCYDGVCIH
jgi:hypothetical protein